jgi:hypothetical protein
MSDIRFTLKPVTKPSAKPASRRGRTSGSSRSSGKSIEQYEHRGAERVNNPPVGLVSPELNGVGARRRYEYDPHLDPQLVWAGKARLFEEMARKLGLEVEL